jgi:hypothetical protein
LKNNKFIYLKFKVIKSGGDSVCDLVLSRFAIIYDEFIKDFAVIVKSCDNEISTLTNEQEIGAKKETCKMQIQSIMHELIAHLVEIVPDYILEEIEALISTNLELPYPLSCVNLQEIYQTYSQEMIKYSQ